MAAVRAGGNLMLWAALLSTSVATSLGSDHLLVGDLDTHAVLRFSSSGEFIDEFVKRRSGGLKNPGARATKSP